MNQGDRGVYLAMTDRPPHLDAWRNAPYDAVIVGGGPAGLSAALVLGRANKRALVVDNHRPANAVSQGVGGLLGHDRVKPADLRSSGLRQLEEHANVKVRHGAVEDVEPTTDGFVLTPTDAAPVRAHAIVLAHGLRYDPPPLPGIEALWGRSVFHCAFCDGWERRDRPLALHGSVVTDAVGHRVRERRVDHDVLGEGSVDRRGRKESHVGAQVVAPGQALRAGQVGHAGFDGHALAHPPGRDAGSESGDLAGGLVTEDQWVLDHEPPDAAVVVVVRVRPADADRADAYEDLARPWRWLCPLFEHHVLGSAQNGSTHRLFLSIDRPWPAGFG